MKKKYFKDKKHFALWVGFISFLLSLTWMLYSLVALAFDPNYSFEFEPIVVFFIAFAAFLSSEKPWEYKRYHFINSHKRDHSFTITDNGGKFEIGSGDKLFDLSFGTSGTGSVQIKGVGYGSQNIKGITIVPGIANVEDINDFNHYNYSTYQRAYAGDFVVLKNSFGNYAALRIVHADARSHGGQDIVKFDYWIL